MVHHRVEQVTEGIPVVVSQVERAGPGARRDPDESGPRAGVCGAVAPALWSSAIGVSVVLVGPVAGTPGWIVAVVGAGAALVGVATLAWASYLGLASGGAGRRRADRVDDHAGW